MFKDEIQTGSIVRKTTPGSSGKPIKVVAVNATHAKIYYLSSQYGEEKAKWFPKKDLALYMLPVPEKKQKHFVIRSENGEDEVVSCHNLSVGDFVILTNYENTMFSLGRVVAQVLNESKISSQVKIYKINGITEIENE